MSEVVDRLAELTGYRDRDVLDVTLVAALADLLRPMSAAIYRPVGEPGDQRWLTRAHLQAGQTTPTADELWAPFDELPRLGDHPLRHQCLVQQAAASHEESPATSVFPLTTECETIGVLEVLSAHPLSGDHWRLVSSILRIYRNFQGLLDYSERDTLTGLLNRKTFDEAFMRAAPVPVLQGPAGGFSRQRRPATGGQWLGVIDIDHFKAVNDGFGHLIGDEVLLLLSRLMRSSFRYHDQLYRFGGEEFVVLMRCAEADGAAQAFERLRTNVQSYAFPRVGHITVSVGFTDIRAGDTPSGAFERADKAVYYVKEHGRNQVGHYGDLVARGQLVDNQRDGGDVELF